MPTLTPAERRAGLIVVLLLTLGTARDAWRARHPDFARRSVPAADHSSATRAPDAGPFLADGVAAHDRSPDLASVTGGGKGEAARGSETPLDLNHASAVELDRLPGVGPVLAGRIVEHRRRHGPFRQVDELLGVRGIGPRLLERIRPYVVLGP